ncbi:MAG TPA: hypothetical protein V6D22_05930 [Candidatus Obscuribacterales bacterium]
MDRITKIVVLGLVIAATCGTAALAEPSSPVQQAIRAYRAKDYRGAVHALSHASAKDELAHYYRALSYQQLSDFGEAECEYTWGYNNARDKDLAAKSWQGLLGLERMRQSHRSIAFSTDTDNEKPAAAATVADNGPHRVKLPTWNVQATPGCGRHKGQF